VARATSRLAGNPRRPRPRPPRQPPRQSAPVPHHLRAGHTSRRRAEPLQDENREPSSISSSLNRRPGRGPIEQHPYIRLHRGKSVERARVNGVELEFELKGSGQPVLLIHGSHLARSYLPLVAQRSLAEACLLIRYQRAGQHRGAGRGRRRPARVSRRPQRARRRPLLRRPNRTTARA
jgi:hypothetical protein